MEKINDKLLNWASILEANTRAQAELTSTMPFIFPYLALMPDAHLGLGSTVGSVIPTLGAIMPAAVGVDIGCGMCSIRTQYMAQDIKDHIANTNKTLTDLRTSIERAVPLSAGAYNKTLTATAQKRVAELEELAEEKGFDPAQYVANWRLQLGTLGSGNHFIEVSLDETDAVWLFLHSGSRGVGNKIATHHIAVAQTYMKRHFIDLANRDLAYLVEGTSEFTAYIGQMQWAQQFALANREEMMDRVIGCFAFWMSETQGQPAPVAALEKINCHHNFTVKEQHAGKPVWLSRKGAINAHKGVMGLIPGSMGTASYVVEGKGNAAALCSSPHGAGRNYSRTAARKTFTRDQLQEAMKGIEYRDTDAFIDEIPMAYKPIETVMHDARDLVEVKHTLHQLISVKGD